MNIIPFQPFCITKHLIQLQPQINNIITMHQIPFNPMKHRCRAMHRISIGKYRPYDGVFIVNIIPFLPFCITKHLIQYSITTTDKQHNNDASNTVQSNEVSMQGNGIYINRMNYFTCTSDRSDRRNSCINSSIFFFAGYWLLRQW